MSNLSGRRVDRPAIIVGVVLLAAAAVVAYDANNIHAGFTYGISPSAVPFVIAAFLAVLGVGHFVAAFKEGLPTPDEADWGAVGLMSAGLFGLIASIAFGGGFILGSTILFALTARSFGRKALIADIAIGFVLGLFIYILFNRLLGLGLPSGRIERGVLIGLDGVVGWVSGLFGSSAQ
ncbi:tripartite tricarboxylate transporter TctB family protein [Antarcticirhabdus aurantiaca]|uniref:Tripartite tricarboxylate transporter TctB family protein n=1 Tax=Antarcticirhabdus aurantiaca TaxID=2606717 RepID=A0ACD4NHY6_9HYPH|nr:tripartite tricarboxylate transporter TctB family protein [Antarcticirhabdus aurantiaca]WAJ26409.1 tripartite tricarboxylate transporter TctB family protein [Jeongeuplla avenae]